MSSNNFFRGDFIPQNGRHHSANTQATSVTPFLHSFGNIPGPNRSYGPMHDIPNYRGEAHRNSNPSYSHPNAPPSRPGYQNPSTEPHFNSREQWPSNQAGNCAPPSFPPPPPCPPLQYHAPPPLPPPPPPFLEVKGSGEQSGFQWNHRELFHDPPFKQQQEEIRLDYQHDDKESNDGKFVHDWTVRVEKRLNSGKEKTQAAKFKISDIQKKMLDYAMLVSRLEELLSRISSLDQDDKQGWIILYQKSEALKEEINAVRSFFGADNVDLIKEIVMKRREKRIRERKTKKSKAESRRLTKERWVKKEKQIDDKLRVLHQQQKAKIDEEKMKREADGVLREVRTKQEEARRMQTLLAGLCSLREARRKKGDVHGYVTTGQADSFFQKLQAEFGKLLVGQLDHYCDEEQTLKVMMEESTNPISQSSKKLPTRLVSEDKLRKRIYELLFGNGSSTKEQREFQRSFTAADESVEILVKRRIDWDQFLSGDDPRSSSVPMGWVVPNLEPASGWKAFQTR